MPRKSSTLDEAVMLIQILTRIPKGRLITAQQLKQELDAAGKNRDTDVINISLAFALATAVASKIGS